MIDPNKIYTYEYTYELIDQNNRRETIQFCASSNEEAGCLFSDWVSKPPNKPSNIYLVKVMVVYNENDAKKYGDKYGTPDEYYA